MFGLSSVPANLSLRSPFSLIDGSGIKTANCYRLHFCLSVKCSSEFRVCLRHLYLQLWTRCSMEKKPHLQNSRIRTSLRAPVWSRVSTRCTCIFPTYILKALKVYQNSNLDKASQLMSVRRCKKNTLYICVETEILFAGTSEFGILEMADEKIQ